MVCSSVGVNATVTLDADLDRSDHAPSRGAFGLGTPALTLAPCSAPNAIEELKRHWWSEDPLAVRVGFFVSERAHARLDPVR